MLEDQDGRRGVAPWCQGIHACDGDIAVDFIEACAANDGDLDGSCGQKTIVSRGIINETIGMKETEKQKKVDDIGLLTHTVESLREVRHGDNLSCRLGI